MAKLVNISISVDTELKAAFPEAGRGGAAAIRCAMLADVSGNLIRQQDDGTYVLSDFTLSYEGVQLFLVSTWRAQKESADNGQRTARVPYSPASTLKSILRHSI